ncbi:MAG: histidine phosphatase family protein [Pseudobdellovibrionaceae bacterium]
MKYLSSIIILTWFWSSLAVAVPAKVVLIRHGEKPSNEQPDLNSMGCERAYQLPIFFSKWSHIGAIYAQQPSDVGSSIRPIETLTPTALQLNLKINNTYHKDEIVNLASEILESPNLNGKVVIIAWEHKMIPEIAEHLGIQLNENLLKWPSSVFDQAWVISFDEKSSSPVLDIMAEHVLPTDIDDSQSGVIHWGKETLAVNNGIQIPQDIIQECQSGNSTLNKKMDSIVMFPVPY